MFKGKATPPKGKRSLDFKTTVGSTCFETSTITSVPIDNRYGLYVFLHECGHAHLHHKDSHDQWAGAPEWEIEYEAETYAIKAMRSAGLSVPQKVLDEARDYVASLLEKHGCADAPTKIWRFAYPDSKDFRR